MIQGYYAPKTAQTNQDVPVDQNSKSILAQTGIDATLFNYLTI
jgi:hypothetical protein